MLHCDFRSRWKIASDFAILRETGAYDSGGVRARSGVWLQAVKVPIFVRFALLRGASLSKYASEGFRIVVRLRRLSDYGSVAHIFERPIRETQAKQYSDTAL